MKARLSLLVLPIIFTLISCGGSKNMVKADPILGNWNTITRGTPEGDINSIMTFTKSAEGLYRGILEIDADIVNLENVIISDNMLISTFTYQGMEFELKGAFLGNTFTGEVSGMGSIYPTKGTKSE